MAIFGETPAELQRNLDLLYTYCNTWGLEVNALKTKVMVFRKRGGLKHDEKWTYNGIAIEAVDIFNYLGTLISYNGSFSKNYEYLSGKALKALNALLINCKKLPLSLKVLCQLFDSFVGSVLSYGSEICGFNKTQSFERLHLKYCKRILKVPLNSSNCAVYGELERYPLYISRYCKIIKYWCKVAHSNNIIVKTLYKLAVDDYLLGYSNWVSRVKKLLDDFGFSDMFLNVNSSTEFIKLFTKNFKLRLIDCFQQEWFGKINTSSILDEYKLFKLNFNYENYLDIIPHNLRHFVTKIRISAHSLRIHSGRFGVNRLPRNERICLYCNLDDIEDTYHFVCICPRYNYLRGKYLKRNIFVRPSVYKFYELLNSHEKAELCNLALFLKEAFTARCNIDLVNQ